MDDLVGTLNVREHQRDEVLPQAPPLPAVARRVVLRVGVRRQRRAQRVGAPLFQARQVRRGRVYFAQAHAPLAVAEPLLRVRFKLAPFDRAPLGSGVRAGVGSGVQALLLEPLKVRAAVVGVEVVRKAALAKERASE